MNVKWQTYIRIAKFWFSRIFNLPNDMFRLHVRDRYILATNDPHTATKKIFDDFTEDEMIDLDRTMKAIKSLNAVAEVKHVDIEEISVFQSLRDAVNGYVGQKPAVTNRLNDIIAQREKFPIERIVTEVVLLCVEEKLLNPSELLKVQDILKQQNIVLDLGQSVTLTVK